jgi:hypothetical protein
MESASDKIDLLLIHTLMQRQKNKPLVEIYRGPVPVRVGGNFWGDLPPLKRRNAAPVKTFGDDFAPSQN